MTPAAKPRVSDETIANLAAGKWEQHEGRVIIKLALDLRDARAEIARLAALLAAVAPVVKAAVVMRADYPELAPVSEINRFARNNGLRDDPRYALLAAVDALPDEARKEFGA